MCLSTTDFNSRFRYIGRGAFRGHNHLAGYQGLIREVILGVQSMAEAIVSSGKKHKYECIVQDDWHNGAQICGRWVRTGLASRYM